MAGDCRGRHRWTHGALRVRRYLRHPARKTMKKKIGPVRGAGKGMAIDGFCAWDGDVLVLNILGTPNASKDAIGKPKGNQLRVSAAAVPVAGRATDHMVRFLAGKFGVDVGAIEVVFGRFNVNKQMRIKAPAILPAVVRKHLEKQMPGKAASDA